MQPLTVTYSPIWSTLKQAKQARIQLHIQADIGAVKRALKRLKYEDVAYKAQCIKEYGHCLELRFNVASVPGSDYIILDVVLVDKIDKVNNILL